MNIFGEVVVLRAVEEKDNDMLLSMLNDPNTEELLGGWSFPTSKQAQLNWFKQLGSDNKILRCIVDVANQGIGMATLTNIDYKNGTACINIKLSGSENKGKGYGTDTIKTLVKYAFEQLRLNCVYAMVLDSNNVSQRLLEKCGFVREGVLLNRCYKQGKFHSYVSFSISRKDI